MKTTLRLMPCLVLAWMLACRPVFAADNPATQPAPIKSFSAMQCSGSNNHWSAVRQYWRAPDQFRVDRAGDPGPTTQPTTMPAGAMQLLMLLNPTGHPQTSVMLGPDSAVLCRTVRFYESPSPGADYAQTWRRLRDLDIPGLAAKGLETIDGQSLMRYEAPVGAINVPMRNSTTTTIWVDPATKRPVRIQQVGPGSWSNGVQQSMTEILSDLRFDDPLDDSVFIWPEFKGKRINLTIRIDARRNPNRDKLSMSVTAPDGKRLLSDADLQPEFRSIPSLAIRIAGLLADSQVRLKQQSGIYVGQKLRVVVDDAPAQEMELLAPIDNLSVTLPLDAAPPSAPTTRPAQR